MIPDIGQYGYGTTIRGAEWSIAKERLKEQFAKLVEEHLTPALTDKLSDGVLLTIRVNAFTFRQIIVDPELNDKEITDEN